ncbi:MAG: hypothetical protein IPP49_14115 [Saprospiraceae bacterium]|nr:hypothetical protein [Saprospiraceae bacterium]
MELVELKSYAPSTLVAMKNSTSSSTNLDLSPVRQTQYWFNGLKGVSVADIKAGFKDVSKTKYVEYFD